MRKSQAQAAEFEIGNLAFSMTPPLFAAGERGTFYMGTSGNDVFGGTALDDIYDLSEGGGDRATAGDGDDLFIMRGGFDGEDRLSGGGGRDTINLLGGNYANLTITRAMASSVEQLLLGSGNFNITLGVGTKFVEINDYSSAGNTVRIDASASSRNLLIRTQAGDDTLIGGRGDDVIVAHPSPSVDSFDGGAGADLVNLAYLIIAVQLDLRATTTQQVGGLRVTIANIEDVAGGTESDRLTGTDDANWLIGNGGDDRLVGLGGDDWFTFGVDGSGNKPIGAIVNGGTGIDCLDLDNLGRASAGVTVDLSRTDTQDTGQGKLLIVDVENVSGTAFDDTIVGGVGANSLYGGGGSDRLVGGDGNDILYGDQRLGGTSDGSRYTRPTVTTIQNGGGDFLDGGDGKDILFGGAGRDTLYGGANADQLTGGAGGDTFAFRRTSDSRDTGVDVILDFDEGDRIDLSAIDADTRVRGDQAFHLGATEGHSGDIVIRYDATSGTTIVDLFTNDDATADMTIALTGNVSLTAADFIL